MPSSSSSEQQLPSLGDSWRRLRDALSFSSVNVRGDTTTHLLHVGRYSRVAGEVCPGECIESVVRAGGLKWRLYYYPNGDEAKRRGRACARLVLLRGMFSSRFWATAEYRVSILGGGRDGEPAAHTCAVAPRSYLANYMDDEVDVLSTAEEQSEAMRRVGADDDSLVVRCDLTVLNAVRESRVKWYLRSLWNN